ncbi:MAG: hypothetical protein HOC78_00170 [Candidatus Komeilibacteria bacterium]|nr:hypothetical protein [Candidatus Komeilibacteria bacterium]
MYNYKEKNKIFRSSSLYINYYFKKANNSFNILFFYLFFSLILGLYYDPYLGKIRWAVILVGIVLANKLILFYLHDKLNNYSRFILLKKIHKYILYFSIFYAIYGLFFKLFLGIEPGYIQSAQVKAWYAIWGTTAYVGLIFIPLLLYSRVLSLNNIISNLRMAVVYLVTLFVAIFYDSRAILIILIVFIAIDILRLSYKLMVVLISFLAFYVLMFSDTFNYSFIDDFLSSGGFLINYLSDGELGSSTRDFDRVAHYIAAYNTIGNSTWDMVFGKGFLNAGKSIINEYHSVYNNYGMSTSVIGSNLAGIASKGTFGLSAFIIENGWLGLVLLIVHLFNMCALAIKTNLVIPAVYIVAAYLLLLFILFIIYINDSMLFYLMLSPSIFLYPLMREER